MLYRNFFRTRQFFFQLALTASKKSEPKNKLNVISVFIYQLLLLLDHLLIEGDTSLELQTSSTSTGAQSDLRTGGSNDFLVVYVPINSSNARA